MRCQGVANSPAQGVGHLIVYGVKGKQNDVSSDVYDGGPYTYENNKVTFETIGEFLKSTSFNEHMDINNQQIIKKKCSTG